MLKEKRLMQISSLLAQDGEVEINNLCRMFNVTEMTIRRDLDNLALDKRIIRTHGGAILSDENILIEKSFDRRMVANNEKKEKIARKALEYLSDGKTVFIDSGSTGYTLARCIPNSLRIIAITNAINIASELIIRSHISVIMIGGVLKKNTLSCRGTIAEETIERFKIDVAFLAANAISAEGYAYIASVQETGFKKMVMKTSTTKYLLVDSSKFDSGSLCRFADVSKFDGVITDDDVTPQQQENLINCGAKLIIA